MSVTNAKILLADDDSDILEMLSYNLEQDGFMVKTVTNGRSAVDEAYKFKPDVIVLDVMMPEKDGVEVCQELRASDIFKNTIIVFVSARSEDFTQLSAFESGADEYLVKPIRPKVFVSRINALLKRRVREIDGGSKRVEIGPFIVDKERFTASYNGDKVGLVRKEFELLFLFVRNPDRVFTRDELINSVWDNDTVVGPRTVDVHMSKLREKFSSKHFVTVKGIGYKFEVEPD
jgi:two-component system alkaline phosphatase synthesis response regulator PhoP